jgi:hypothetical protein
MKEMVNDLYLCHRRHYFLRVVLYVRMCVWGGMCRYVFGYFCLVGG